MTLIILNFARHSTQAVDSMRYEPNYQIISMLRRSIMICHFPIDIARNVAKTHLKNVLLKVVPLYRPIRTP